MKLVFSIVLMLLMVASFAFAGQVTLVKYYSLNADSHACNPADPNCRYAYDVNIDGNYAATCGTLDSTRVLGLASQAGQDQNLNAHAERGDTQHNYNDVNLCMKTTAFGGNPPICEYTTNSTCRDSNYTCLFGLSDATNAHLSDCNTFTPEIKFCCKFPGAAPPAPQTCAVDFSASGRYFRLGDKIGLNYQCNGSPSSIATDINLIVKSSAGIVNYFYLTSPNDCNGSTKTFLLDTTGFNLDGNQNRDFSAEVVPKNSLCPQPAYSFNIRLPNTQPPEFICDIDSFNAAKASEDNNVLANYSCLTVEGVDANLFILDKNGSIECRQINFKCKSTGPNSVKFCDSLADGVYTARLMAGNCVKETYFSISKKGSSSVPDYGPLSIAALIAGVLFIIYGKKRD